MTRIHTFNRRHFLVGAGGFTLGVPFLSSLAPRTARGATPTRQKRLVNILSDHGGIFSDNFNPQDPTDMTVRELYPASGSRPAHNVRWGSLNTVREQVDGRTRLSNTLHAPSDILTDTLLGKMNVITGFDITVYIGHTFGGMLGNYAANTMGPSLGNRHIATIDQLIAKSPCFVLQQPKESSINYRVGWQWSWGSSIENVASVDVINDNLVPIQFATDPRVLWERLFKDLQANEPDPRPSVVNKVLDHYRGIVNGVFGDASRISAADRQRLDLHIEHLHELERKLNVTLDCTAIPKPPHAVDEIPRMEQFIDIAATALSCGATHVVTTGVAAETLSPDPSRWWGEDWHEDVAHQGSNHRQTHDPRGQRTSYEAQQQVFERIVLELARRLDSIDQGDGTTLLDDTLIMWTLESGQKSHDSISVPVVTFGGAGDFFETGRFIDYRNRDNLAMAIDAVPDRRPGILYNQWLSNVLQSMGLSPSDWASELQRVNPNEYAAGSRGYGLHLYDADNYSYPIDIRADAWPEQLYQDADRLLPGLVKGADV